MDIIEEIINQFGWESIVDEQVWNRIKDDPYKHYIMEDFLNDTFFDYLTEMVNLTPKYTGYRHCLNMVTGEAKRHGPRIKIALNCKDTLDKRKTSVIAFSEQSDPKFITKTSLVDINKKEKESYLDFVKRNKAKLLKYWNTGIDMSEEEKGLLFASLEY